MVDRPVCEVQLTIRFADVLPADQAVYSNSGTSGHVPRVVEGAWHSGRGAIRVTNDCWRPPARPGEETGDSVRHWRG